MTDNYDFLSKLIKKDKIEITTQTSSHSNIENEQYVKEQMQDALFNKIVEDSKKKFSGVRIRNNPTNCYNCHGMTFASRRTGIYDPSEVSKILVEDKYSQIAIEDLIPGDIVVYFATNGDPEHSGIVLSIEKIGSSLVPMIVSKWGITYEVVHSVYDSPYEDLSIEYYRCKL